MSPSAVLVVCLLASGVTKAEHTLAIFPVNASEGVSARVAAVVTDQLVDAVRQQHAFERVTSPLEVAALMPREQQQLLMACAQEECAVIDNELVGALGVTHVLFSALTRIGDSFIWTLKIIEVRSALVVASTSERVRSASGEAVLDAIIPTTARLLGQLPWHAPAPAAAGAAKPSSNVGLWAGAIAAGAGSAVLGVGSLAALTAGVAWLFGIFTVPALVGVLTAMNPKRDDGLFFATRYVPIAALSGLSVFGALVGVAALVAAGALVAMALRG